MCHRFLIFTSLLLPCCQIAKRLNRLVAEWSTKLFVEWRMKPIEKLSLYSCFGFSANRMICQKYGMAKNVLQFQIFNWFIKIVEKSDEG